MGTPALRLPSAWDETSDTLRCRCSHEQRRSNKEEKRPDEFVKETAQSASSYTTLALCLLSLPPFNRHTDSCHPVVSTTFVELSKRLWPTVPSTKVCLVLSGQAGKERDPQCVILDTDLKSDRPKLQSDIYGREIEWRKP